MGGNGDESAGTINHYHPTQRKWTDAAVIIALTLNILVLAGFVFGGMKWVTEVNTNIGILTTRQETVIATIKSIQEFDISVVQRHAIEDAFNEVQKFGERKVQKSK